MASVMRVVCVVWWAAYFAAAYFAWAKGEWFNVLDAIVHLQLGVVLWFAFPPGAEIFQVPTVGTRPLRLLFYWSIFLVAFAAGLRDLFEPERASHVGTTTFLLSLFLVGPCLSVEMKAWREDA
jgi:hypothetical protein